MYDKNEKILTLAKNNENEILAFRDVYKEGKDLFPVFRFNGGHSTTKVCMRLLYNIMYVYIHILYV